MSGSGRIWIEISNREDQRPGGDWAVGSALWSPARDRGGGDRYHLMRKVAAGDRVLHFLRDTWGDGGPPETRIVGTSRARSGYREVIAEPRSKKSPAESSSFYRIALTAFESYSAPIPVQQLLDDYFDEIKRELTEVRPRHYPFSLRKSDGRAELRTNRGMYLAACTSFLYLMIRDALSINESDVLAPLSGSVHTDFAEGRRSLREQYFFIRNVKLAREIKRKRGYACEACGLRFGDVYGPLGEDYVECHSLVAAERDDPTKPLALSPDEVVVLCANCHRMVHRRDPPLTIPELRGMLRRAD